jgi:sn-glycerol 3-phosphate transport system substrate-binding protein
MKARALLFALAAATTVAVAAPAPKVTEIQFWHAMDGALGEHVDRVVAEFNASQSEYRVAATYKGGYDETLALGIAAHAKGKAPNILQVYDVGTASMMASRNLYRPAHEVLTLAGVKLDSRAFVQPVASYFADANGRLVAFPFNTSTPVLYYNKDAFAAAGLDPNVPPKTWYDVQAQALKLYEKQAAPCALTTTWPGWIMLENVLALHNEEFATGNNGFDGVNSKLSFNTMLAMRHVALLNSWVKSRLFYYTGRRDEGEKRFIAGECAMLTSSSASYAKIRQGAKFGFAVAPLPYYEDFRGAPYNTLMGGAGLWVMSGKKAAEDRGVAKFFAFLAQPEVQAAWHQRTGYLPISRAAYDLTREQGFYERNPGTDVAVRQMMHNGGPADHSRGIRLGNHVYIRAILDEELEAVWAGNKLPKAALDQAVERGNVLLKRFADSARGTRRTAQAQ